MAETFNAYIINARTKHLICMLEDIRTALMARIVTKNKEATKWAEKSNICPRVLKKLEKAIDDASKCTATPSSPTVFQVSHNIDVLTVDLELKSCTCRQWDLTGIPCCHAVSAIFFTRAKAEDYVHEFYTIESHRKCYSGSISPLPGERHWPKFDSPMNPPPIKIGPGRPRKNRRKDPYEKESGKLSRHGLQMSCSVCKSTSHNKRKCPDKDKPVEPPLKKRPGRPRKTVARGGTYNNQSTTEHQHHHNATVEPSRIGKGGRVIRSGRGSRGGGTSSTGGGRNAGSGGSSRGGGTSTRGGGSTNTRGGGRTSGRGGGRASGRGGGRTSGRGGSSRGATVPHGFGVYVDIPTQGSVCGTSR